MRAVSNPFHHESTKDENTKKRKSGPTEAQKEESSEAALAQAGGL
jgi:hypothetical protein